MLASYAMDTQVTQAGVELRFNAQSLEWKLRINKIPERFWNEIDEMVNVAISAHREYLGKECGFDTDQLADLIGDWDRQIWPKQKPE